MKNAYILLVTLFFVSFVNAQSDQYKELMSQDWANLKKYRADNDSIHKSGKYPKVVFMGNSITEGWYSMHPQFFKEHNFVGRGISGQTTPQMLIRFMPDVIDLRPEAVVILAGTNDIAGNTGFSSLKMITDNIKAMAELAVQNNIKVILSSILPAYDYPWRPGLEPHKKIAEVNAWIMKYAKENNFTYLDYFTSLADERPGMKPAYAEDGVHPTDEGYKVMEPLVIEAIEKTLGN